MERRAFPQLLCVGIGMVSSAATTTTGIGALVVDPVPTAQLPLPQGAIATGSRKIRASSTVFAHAYRANVGHAARLALQNFDNYLERLARPRGFEPLFSP